MEPIQELEVRVIVYGAVGVPMMDVEGTSDVFFKLYFGNGKKNTYKTDCHYRNMDGAPNFNWRCKIPWRDTYKSDKRLHITCWDRDLIGSNDSIGSNTVDLKSVIEDCLNTKREFKVNKRYYNSHLCTIDEFRNLEMDWFDDESFEIPIFEKEGFQKSNGDMRIGISILTKEEAEENEIGKGRSEPNMNPYLSPPEGRIELSLNPIKMLRQLIAPHIWLKILKYFSCLLCCALCIYLAPSLLSAVAGNFIAGMI